MTGRLSSGMLHNFVFCIVLNCIDTIVVVLSDWCDTGARPSENLKKLPIAAALASCRANKPNQELRISIWDYNKFKINTSYTTKIQTEK